MDKGVKNNWLFLKFLKSQLLKKKKRRRITKLLRLPKMKIILTDMNHANDTVLY